jgi:membrane fusion protein, multidrug efflux system
MTYTRFGTGAVVLLIILAVTYWGWAYRNEPAAALPTPAPVVPVTVATVVRREVQHLTRAVGNVVSLHNVTLRSQVDGVLTAIHFVEGQRVAPGDLLVTIDDRTFVAVRDQARAELARNEAELQSAQIDLTRYRALAERAAVAAQVVDQQIALVAQLEARIAASRAAIVAAEVALSHTRIVSPVRGRVGLRLVDPGNLVRAGDSAGLVSVAQIAPIGVSFALPQELLPSVQALVLARDTNVVRVRERANGALLAEGHLSFVDNSIDAATGTIRVKAEFANEDERLWPGQFVSVELATATTPAALVVDLSAIQRGMASSFAYRVHGDSVDAIDVQIAYEDESIAVITSGLVEGDTVVIDGQSRLKPGTKVHVLDTPDGG